MRSQEMITSHPAAELPICPKKKNTLTRTELAANDYLAPGGEAAHLSEKENTLTCTELAADDYLAHGSGAAHLSEKEKCAHPH